MEKLLLYVTAKGTHLLTLWSRASSLQTCEIIHFCYSCHSLWGSLLQQPKQANTVFDKRDSRKEAAMKGPYNLLDGWPSTHSLNNPIDKELQFTKPPFYIHYLPQHLKNHHFLYLNKKAFFGAFVLPCCRTKHLKVYMLHWLI